ncbi:MAG: hypothetical protein A2X36_04375 [Elusimicrobia bacterium GWA2_69_24]|nr:MAG: hypothetical protein A2X36_04375 [Elusimicrobia bacterium GWA2_69_24]
MKALILTGGLGTRLRPLTCTLPKPLLPVANVPFLTHQILNLRQHGIREIVLATGYRPPLFRRLLGDGRSLGVRLRYAAEKSPLGTGGAVRNAARFLKGTTLILNGDVLQKLDVGALRRAHRRNRAEVTISLVHVQDPTLYGLVEVDAAGRIRRFLEKPSLDEITCDTINAGAYVFDESVFARIAPEVPYSLERGLFPRLLAEGRRMYGFVTHGYWMDIGTLDKFLQAHRDILEGRAAFALPGYRKLAAFLLAPGARLAPGVRHEGVGRVVLGPATEAAASVRFVGSVCVGADCRIEADAVLEDCVVLDRTRIGPGAQLSGCIVGRRCRIGANAVIGAGRTLGDGCVIQEFSRL